ncbi:MAG: DUF2802 domain-containing protein [Methylococcaceae bacterium]
MINVLLISSIVITIILLGVLAWLILEHRKLKQNFICLSNNVQRINNDIAGICLAAISVDNRISHNGQQLEVFAEKLVNSEQNGEQLNHPYSSAIGKVRHGANIEELIQQCGLSKEEAELLIRLHG